MAWKKELLREVLQNFESGCRPKGGVQEIVRGIPSIGGEHLNSDGGFDFSNLKYIPEKFYEKLSRGLIKKEDVLIVKDGATTGKTSFVGEFFPYNKAAVNEHVFLARVNHKIIAKLLFYYLISLEGQFQLKKCITGTAQGGINLSVMDKISIKYPESKLEQMAIVSEIEKQFTRLDESTKSLKAARKKLELYRKAVLNSAFEGKLNNLEKCKNVKLGELSILITKGASPTWQGIRYIDDSSQVLFITSENVRENHISLAKRKYLEIAFNTKQRRSILKKGDVLLNIVGASIGRAAIFDLEDLANINQAVALIRLKPQLNNRYLSYFLNSEVARLFYNKNKVEVARANLSLNDVSNIPIPVYSLGEQQEIVQEIDSRFSVIDRIDKIDNESLVKVEHLKNSILKEAFEGNLMTFEA